MSEVKRNKLEMIAIAMFLLISPIVQTFEVPVFVDHKTCKAYHQSATYKLKCEK